MIVILISGVATAINLLIAAASLYFSRAPGWRHYRTFALVSLILGLYALNDLWFNSTGAIGPTRIVFSTINFFFAGCASSLLLVFNRQQSQTPLSRLDKILLLILMSFAVMVLIPGVGVNGSSLVEVSSVDIIYQMPNVTAIGKLSMALDMTCLLVTMYRYSRAAIRGEKGAWLNAIGTGLFVLFSFEEAAVAAQLLNWPFLLDCGVASMVMLVAVDLSSKVSRNSREINDLNKDLERRVIKYSEELASTQEELFVAERQVALEQLAAGIGHEINNPLASVGGNLEFLRDTFAGCKELEEEVEAVHEALDGVRRIRQIVCDLTVSALKNDSDKVYCNPADAIGVAIRLVAPEYRSKVGFSVDLCCESWVRIDESGLVQVLLNLFTNAAQSVEATNKSGSPVEIRCWLTGGQMRIDVTDCGTGIDQQIAHRIFDPLFTTKEVGVGTGLGLYVSKSIIKSSGGELLLSESDSEGTTMSILLHLASPHDTQLTSQLVPGGTDDLEEPDDLSRVRVYLIDDDAMVTRAMQRMARGLNFSVETDSEIALEHLLAGHHYDLILCDLMMPKMTGMELYRQCESQIPGLCENFVFITGGAVTGDAQDFVESPGIRVLAKPLSLSTLRKAVAQAKSSQSSVSR